jgi:hypothetical protein
MIKVYVDIDINVRCNNFILNNKCGIMILNSKPVISWDL